MWKIIFYLTEKNIDNYDIFKESKKHKIWQVNEKDAIGSLLITFDKKKVYNLWTDFPLKFKQSEIEIIKEEMPYWYDFFNDRMAWQRLQWLSYINNELKFKN